MESPKHRAFTGGECNLENLILGLIGLLSKLNITGATKVYLYETEDGEEIAVGFKDGRTIFGRREDIQGYYSGERLMKDAG